MPVLTAQGENLGAINLKRQINGVFMGISDHEYVNFSEKYELNYHLKKVNKAQSQNNRDTLVVMGNELKKELDVTMVTHKQFHDYVKNNLERLED